MFQNGQGMMGLGQAMQARRPGMMGMPMGGQQMQQPPMGGGMPYPPQGMPGNGMPQPSFGGMMKSDLPGQTAGGMPQQGQMPGQQQAFGFAGLSRQRRF